MCGTYFLFVQEEFLLVQEEDFLLVQGDLLLVQADRLLWGAPPPQTPGTRRPAASVIIKQKTFCFPGTKQADMATLTRTQWC